MILIDANLLIYAIDSASPHHDAARRWLEKVLSSSENVGLTWGVILAFLRIVTHPAVVRHPLSPEAALEYVDSWLAQPYVRTVAPGEKHWLILRNLLRSSGTAGNLTSDAHLAALALELDCEIFSSDHDFKRFQGVKHVNPLEK
ncbi:MAG: type II toxin-antitoxin system VapC family toxin [Acidobacteriota bacterium]|jgi:toxin-antitoxin system PIN domain toxin